MPSTRAKSWMSQSRVARPQRRHREPAVAGDHRGDAVEAARRGVGLEGELRVVVGVRVDDARGDDPAAGVELTGPRAVDEADLGDATARDGHVGPAPREPGAVHDDAVADHQVVGGHWRARLEHVLVFEQAGRDVCSYYLRLVDPIMARKMWRTLEPYHGLVYFAPEARRRLRLARHRRP